MKRNPVLRKPHIYTHAGRLYARRDRRTWAGSDELWLPAHLWCRAKNKEHVQ